MSLSRVSMSPLSEVIKTGGSSVRIKGEECRRYVSAMRMEMGIAGRVHSSVARITYEVRYRDKAPDGRAAWSRADWLGWLQRPSHQHDRRYDTPEAVRAALAEVRPKHAFVPAWATFNFDRVIMVLGGMLGALTIVPELSTSDFRGKERFRVKGINQASDMHAIMDAGSVFVHNGFSALGRTDALWALVTAINIAGADVLLLTSDCDGNGAALCRDVAGKHLAQGITAALSTLAGLYSLAGAGDAFGVALVKGMHSVLTVVGHCDEGGFMRDLLRAGDYAVPHGGIPQHIPVAAGVPTIEMSGLAQLCGSVDSILLASAALVAHCDPTDEVDGDVFPTVIKPTSGMAGTVLSEAEMARGVLANMSAAFTTFTHHYARGLGKLFGLVTAEDGRYGASMLEGFFSCLCEAEDTKLSRHLMRPVVAPFFWVEPTTILPSKYLGTRAEAGSIGSLVGWNEQNAVPFLPEAVATGAADHFRSHWAISMRNLRSWLGYTFLANHRKDGVANLHLKNFDCESLVLTRKTPAEVYEIKKNQGYIDPGELAWVRGQSRIPHPAECLNVDGRVGLTVWHRSLGGLDDVTDISQIPREDLIHKVMIQLTATTVTSIANGPASSESCEVKRERSRGVRTLEICREQSRSFVQGMVCGIVASERPPARVRGTAPSGTASTVCDTTTDMGGGSSAITAGYAEAQVRGSTEEVAGARIPVARQHGAVTAPQPKVRPAPEAAQVVPAHGDGFVTPRDGGSPVAAHAQGDSSGAAGAAPTRR